MLRQQRARRGARAWRSPTSSRRATVAGPTTSARSPSRPAIGLDELVARFEAAHDDYNAILAKALADRLAEALRRAAARAARRDWGYGRSEHLSPEDLLHERYRGIRPAPGYPACPDHTEKGTLFGCSTCSASTGSS